MRRIVITLAMILFPAGSLLADGVIVPRPEPWLPPRPSVNVKYHHVDVRIDDPVAVTKIDQVFINPYQRDIEGEYIFPIPEDAAINRFAVTVGDRKMEAELLDADQARKVYEDIVRRRKDPAILEYSGRGMYRLRIYPMPPGKDVRVQIDYRQTLKTDYGTVEYLYPLNTEKYSGTDLEDCRVDVLIKSFENIGTAYCASHDVDVDRKGDKEIEVSYFEKNVRPDRDFLLYFTRQKKDFGFHLLSHRQYGEKDGFFLGILSPPLERRGKEFDKNVIFVFDKSGSMAGEKIEQAKGALQYCLNSLNPGDDFNMIEYDDDIDTFKSGLVPADKANIKEADELLKYLKANGGTNIYEALEKATQMIPDDGDPTYIIFLTDGLPTTGITDIKKIIDNTTSKNEGRARLFIFGVGFNVNAHLLDRLAAENQGVPEYVQPGENIEAKVSRFYSKISHPAMSDIKLTFGDIDVYRVYPGPFPDLYYGSEILVTGRYKGGGRTNVILEGKLSGNKISYRFPVEFFEGKQSGNDFVALLWANRRIGYLLQEMRLHGTSDELLDEVVALSKKYGIVTEYTSFLVTGDSERTPADFFGAPDEASVKALDNVLSMKRQQQTGASGVRQSIGLQSQIASKKAAPAGQVYMEGQVKSFENAVAQIGSQGFFKAGDKWMQGDLDGDKVDFEIKQYSRAYFQLLEQDPDLGRYFSLGDTVRFKIGNQIIQVSDKGKEFLTDNEMKTLFAGYN